MDIKTYEIVFRNGVVTQKYAKTAASAKYKAYLDSDSSESFLEYLKGIQSCLCISSRIVPSNDDDTAFAHVAKERDISFAKIGMRVIVGGRPGVIIGSNSSMNLDILFDGSSTSANCHPHNDIKYLKEDGCVLASY